MERQQTMNKDNHQDRLILELRRKYKQEHSAVPVRERKGFKERILYGGLCTIMLPAYMQDMAQKDRLAKYRNLLHPDVAVTDGNADATFTFSSVGGAAGSENPEQRMEKLRADMRKVWKQAVFYDKGTVMAGEIPVPWMDCRTFCLDTSLYCLLFLFAVQGRLILGNFHCRFPEYDRWKPAALGVLETIEEGGGHERLPDQDRTV